MKEFIFEYIDDPYVKVTIWADHFTAAYEILVSITKHPTDFNCISV